jgi:hypothetical protein
MTYLIALWAGFHAFVVMHEEPRLTVRFGGQYAEYRQHVSRWLPSWPGWPDARAVEPSSSDAESPTTAPRDTRSRR